VERICVRGGWLCHFVTVGAADGKAQKPIGGEVEAHFYYFPAPGLIMAVMYAPLLPNDKRTPEEALKGA